MKTRQIFTIIFQIVTNYGGGYDIKTGIFTCPKDGVYFITFTIGQRDRKRAQAHLVNNDVGFIDAVADATEADMNSQGGNSVVIPLKQGDRLHVRADRDNGGHFEGENMLRTTTFSGFYLFG